MAGCVRIAGGLGVLLREVVGPAGGACGGRVRFGRGGWLLGVGEERWALGVVKVWWGHGGVLEEDPGGDGVAERFCVVVLAGRRSFTVWGRWLW